MQEAVRIDDVHRVYPQTERMQRRKVDSWTRSTCLLPVMSAHDGLCGTALSSPLVTPSVTQCSASSCHAPVLQKSFSEDDEAPAMRPTKERRPVAQTKYSI